MNKHIRQVLLPILAAAIWGSAFVFQNKVSDTVGAFTFNACRAIIATVFLLILHHGICESAAAALPPNQNVNFSGAVSPAVCAWPLRQICSRSASRTPPPAKPDLSPPCIWCWCPSSACF